MDIPTEVKEAIRKTIQRIQEEETSGERHATNYHTFELAANEVPATEAEKRVDAVNQIFMDVDPFLEVCLSKEESFNVTSQVKTLAWSVLYDAMHGAEGGWLQQATLSYLVKEGIKPINPEDDLEAAKAQTSKYTPMFLRWVLLYLAEQLRLGRTPDELWKEAEAEKAHVNEATIEHIVASFESGELSVAAVVQMIREDATPKQYPKSEDKPDGAGRNHGQYL